MRLNKRFILKSAAILACLLAMVQSEAAVPKWPSQTKDYLVVCQYNVGPKKRFTKGQMKACMAYSRKVLKHYEQLKAEMAPYFKLELEREIGRQPISR